MPAISPASSPGWLRGSKVLPSGTSTRLAWAKASRRRRPRSMGEEAISGAPDQQGGAVEPAEAVGHRDQFGRVDLAEEAGRVAADIGVVQAGVDPRSGLVSVETQPVPPLRSSSGRHLHHLRSAGHADTGAARRRSDHHSPDRRVPRRPPTRARRMLTAGRVVQPRPRFGLRPWLALLRLARRRALAVRFDMADQATRPGSRPRRATAVAPRRCAWSPR